MDELNLQPDALTTPDSTFEVEGYDAHVEEIEKAYPEEDFRTPAEQQADLDATLGGQQPTAEGMTAPEPTAEGEVQPTEQPVEQQPEPEQPKEPTRFTWQYDENGDIPVEQIQAAYGGKVPEALIRKLALTKDFIPKELQLRELLSDGNNLEKQLQAFNMIREDQELVDRYDHNEDGEVTYADIFDTTNLNGGAGMTDEEDAIATQEWIAGLQSKSPSARLQALWQQNGAGQNMARYINLRRQHALSDVGEDERNVGEGIRQSTSGALFDLTADTMETIGSVGDVLQGKSWHDDSTLDDQALQHTNENSLEYMVNHNLKRSVMDTLTYEVGYWAIPTLLTGSAAGAAGKSMMTFGAAKNVPALIKAGQFLQPSLTGGKVTVTGLAKGQGLRTAVTRPAQGWFGRQKAVQAINMTKSAGKSIMIADMPVAMFTNLEESGRGMMYEDGILKNIIQDDPNGHFYISALAKGSNSPMFKRADFMFTEGVLGVMGTVGLGGLGRTIGTRGSDMLGALPQVPGKITKFSQEALDRTVATTRNHSARVENALQGQEAFFKQTQQQLSDWAEAATEQMNKGADGFKNAFAENIDTDGLMKSAYGAYKNGSTMLGQGYSKARDGIRQVLNDWDEIRHTVGVSNPGSTNSLFSQTDMARAAKGGIDEKQLDLFAKDLVDDVKYKGQVKTRDPKARRGIASDTSLDGIKEAVLGRNAGNTSPREFWGDLLD